MNIDLRTTPISFASYKSITDSKGLFDTWTDIVNKTMDELPVNSQILGSVLKSPEEVIGDNIVFQNIDNGNVYYFNDDITKHNNKATQTKMVMMLYTDYMLPFEVDNRDMKSAVAWSELIAKKVATLYQAKQDVNNLTVIDEINKYNIALGQVKIIADCDKDIADGVKYEDFKNLGATLGKIRTLSQYKRTKFMKGYNSSNLDFLISPVLSINLLTGKTYSSASPQAYSDMESEFQMKEFFGYNYKTTLYLGSDVGMSEFADKQTTLNEGECTGQLLKHYSLSNLHGLMVYRQSIAFYGHNFTDEVRPMTGSRTKSVQTFFYRMNAAVKPVYASINLSFFNAIPTSPSYTMYDGTVVPARDYSKAADLNALRNELVESQPQLYNKVLPKVSNLTQEQVNKIWTDANVKWKLPKATGIINKNK